MIILAINISHDSAVAVADDYDILAAVQAERLTRVKSDSTFLIKDKERRAAMVSDALRVAGVGVSDIGQVITTRGAFPLDNFRMNPLRRLRYTVKKYFGKNKVISVTHELRRKNTLDISSVLRGEAFLSDYELPANLPLAGTNHHYAHALSALFHTDWEDALIYTADGGGDGAYYSTFHYKDGQIATLFGGEEQQLNPSFTAGHSVGLVYSAMTAALGYRANRHEGKLTGLAAFGKPVACDEIKKHYTVRDDGLIATDFKHGRAMRRYIAELSKEISPEDAAASVQKFLEDTVLAAIGIYLQKTGAKKIALAGGVFANVALNRRIAELPGVEEVFIFPAMGDEGLTIGGIYDFLLQRDGMAHWASQRRRLSNVYLGGSYDDEAAALFQQSAQWLDSGEAPAQTAARLLAQGAIVAIYHGRMEFGPRALGARSIMASPVNAEVNQTLNERLQRTEFMPFAPYVLEEDAAEVFEVSSVSRYAMRFMTITTAVKAAWRARIPAVVHVDGTARPQIIHADDNPLYAAVLRAFKAETGLPVLVNTSFNAHEEPIVYKPEECLRALNDGRVDYVLLADGVYRKKAG